MDNVFLAEIRLFAGTYPPAGWAFCQGQLIQIRQYSALFALLGTVYGGDGKNTFALPNLQGSIPVGVGTGLGLSQRVLGEVFGSESTTLLQENLPRHTHTVNAVSATGTVSDPTNDLFASKGRGDSGYTNAVPNVQMNPLTVGVAGGSIPVSNMQPYMALNYIIAMQGQYPARN
ncbi:phage tail protein [Mucilaginibacter agri]|uniref:Phage tail protein n=1 Tax=Mucilaginibacter agri TaxID=2695265 RepID=A0A966DSK4_9SPHI|nr:tail fiber protein [Mucilaginibacter agri]NCD70238.1 phage tail protein [Mucilaginibacter agri]